MERTFQFLAMAIRGNPCTYDRQVFIFIFWVFLLPWITTITCTWKSMWAESRHVILSSQSGPERERVSLARKNHLSCNREYVGKVRGNVGRAHQRGRSCFGYIIAALAIEQWNPCWFATFGYLVGWFLERRCRLGSLPSLLLFELCRFVTDFAGAVEAIAGH